MCFISGVHKDQEHHLRNVDGVLHYSLLSRSRSLSLSLYLSLSFFISFSLTLFLSLSLSLSLSLLSLSLLRSITFHSARVEFLREATHPLILNLLPLSIFFPSSMCVARRYIRAEIQTLIIY